MDVVFSRQRIGTSVVFAHQYPYATSKTTGGRRRRQRAGPSVERVLQHWEEIEAIQKKKLKGPPPALVEQPAPAPTPVQLGGSPRPAAAAKPGAVLQLDHPKYSKPTAAPKPAAPARTEDDERRDRRRAAELKLMKLIVESLI